MNEILSSKEQLLQVIEDLAWAVIELKARLRAVTEDREQGRHRETTWEGLYCTCVKIAQEAVAENTYLRENPLKETVYVSLDFRGLVP